MVSTHSKLDTLYHQELAEGVEVQLRVAGPFLRLSAYVIDLLATLVVLLVAIWCLLWMGWIDDWDLDLDSGQIVMGIYLLVLFVVWWFYPVLFEAGAKGATLGKRAMGLRVVNESGTRITLGQAMVRNFIRSVEVFFPLLPLVAFFSPRFQRLGDLAAGTLVVYTKTPSMPVTALTKAESVPVPYPLTREERAAILLFRDRVVSWSPERRNELAAHLEPLTRCGNGAEGVERLEGMARWLEERG